MSSFSASCHCCCHCRSRRSRPHCNRRYGHQRKRKELLSSAQATLRHRKLSGHSTLHRLATVLLFHRACYCFTVSLSFILFYLFTELDTVLLKIEKLYKTIHKSEHSHSLCPTFRDTAHYVSIPRLRSACVCYRFAEKLYIFNAILTTAEILPASCSTVHHNVFFFCSRLLQNGQRRFPT